VNGTSLDHGLAAACWVAVVGGSILLVAYFVALPTAILVGGWLLFLASLVGAFALAVVASRREGVGVARALARGVTFGVKWIVAFLP
jgi:hypothetical protein